MTILKPLYRLKKYISLYKREIIIGFVLVVVANILYAVLPKILQIIIDKIEQGIASRQLIFYVGLLVFITAVFSGIRFLMRRIIVGVARKIEYHLRNDYFLHLQKLSQNFFIKNKTGDLMARATNDVRSVAMTLGRAYLFFLGNVVVFIVVFVLMVTTNLRLTLLALIPFPLVIFIVYKSMNFFFQTYQKIQEKFSDITAKTQENISGVRVVKAYVQEEHEIKKFMNLNQSYLDENLKLARARGLLSASVEVLFGLAFIVLLWVGGNATIKNQISIGDFVAFTVWLGMLSWPIFSFGWVINLVQRASASMKRINAIMDEKPEIQNTEICDKSIKSINGEIEFKNVSFAYEKMVVLKNINFKIEAGKTAAIVGPTGSGKTTLINLILRLIDSTSGTILIDGKNIRTFRLKMLRKNIGYVPQETFLFSETIEENISFGVKNPEFKEIDWAARVSTIRDDLVNFPDKYQTLIGERGVNLSGGQKQRTAISRALLKKPKILILDDALSSVDTYTEEKILTGFKENNNQQTNLVISHRISSVKHADNIFVLFKGEIVERGRHDELIDKRGFYAELYQQQLLEEALEEL
ncbi:ABC transporter ATP-binding protein [candidate division KSB1 bacterium]|nr:ABC transporter ATP-binding protein [candidate division KSB1 bacterium]MBL7093956.1 ABC transporter ATP-binding protein [candidate division KSB1 bacterium]